MRTALGAVSDRTLNRAIIGLGLALVIGLPTVGLLYVVDRNVDPGPPMTQRAVDAAEAAIRKEPNNLSNRLRLAEAYVAADRRADAIAQYTEILRVEPTNGAALIGRGETYMAMGDLTSAARDYQALIDEATGEEMANVDPRLETAYYALGSIALKQGRPADATTMLAKALRINRTDADALTLMGTALLATGDANNAVDVLRRAIALVPSGWSEPYAQLAKAYTTLGDEAGATYAAAMVALCEKRYVEAEAQLKPLVDGAYSRDALIGLGLLAEATGDVQAGVTYYSRVYAADPTDFDAITGLNRLGASPAPQSSSMVLSTPSASTSVGN
ncbi:MAG: tetratricopeptide repeat protein [Betaproteobacteria bacterium]